MLKSKPEPNLRDAYRTSRAPQDLGETLNGLSESQKAAGSCQSKSRKKEIWTLQGHHEWEEGWWWWGYLDLAAHPGFKNLSCFNMQF